MPDEALTCEQIGAQLAAWQRTQKQDKVQRDKSADPAGGPNTTAQVAQRNDRLQQLVLLGRTRRCGPSEPAPR